jgi:hypothetical protein
MPRSGTPRRTLPRGRRDARRGRSFGERGLLVLASATVSSGGAEEGAESPRSSARRTKGAVPVADRHRTRAGSVLLPTARSRAPPAWPHARGRRARARHLAVVSAEELLYRLVVERMLAFWRRVARRPSPSRFAPSSRRPPGHLRSLPALREGDRAPLAPLSARGLSGLEVAVPWSTDRARRPVLGRLPREHRGRHEGAGRAAARPDRARGGRHEHARGSGGSGLVHDDGRPRRHRRPDALAAAVPGLRRGRRGAPLYPEPAARPPRSPAEAAAARRRGRLAPAFAPADGTAGLERANPTATFTSTDLAYGCLSAAEG